MLALAARSCHIWTYAKAALQLGMKPGKQVIHLRLDPGEIPLLYPQGSLGCT